MRSGRAGGPFHEGAKLIALLLACMMATSGCKAAAGPPAEPDSLRSLALQHALQSFNAAFRRADSESRIGGPTGGRKVTEIQGSCQRILPPDSE